MSKSGRPLIAVVIFAVLAVAGFLLIKSPDVPAQPPQTASPSRPESPRSPATSTIVSSPSNDSGSPGKSNLPPPKPQDSAWESEWRRLSAQPATPERDIALAVALKQLAAISVKTAEEQLLLLHPTDRVSVVAASLAAAATHSSDEAVREAIQFCDEDPAYALEYGRSLISVLAKTGDYPAALDFVLAEDTNGWLGENGSKWLTSLFTSWAAAAPLQAAEAAQKSVGAGQRGEALQTVAAAWAKTDPLAAANFAWQLPASTERNMMLGVALHQWNDADPAAATAWLDGKKSPGR